MSEGGNALDRLYDWYVEQQEIERDVFLPLNRITVNRSDKNEATKIISRCFYRTDIKHSAWVLGIKPMELESAEHSCGVIISETGKEFPYPLCKLMAEMLRKRLERIHNPLESKRAALIWVAREAYLCSSGGRCDDPDELVIQWIEKTLSTLQNGIKGRFPRDCSNTRTKSQTPD